MGVFCSAYFWCDLFRVDDMFNPVIAHPEQPDGKSLRFQAYILETSCVADYFSSEKRIAHIVSERFTRDLASRLVVLSLFWLESSFRDSTAVAPCSAINFFVADLFLQWLYTLLLT